jgi:hypothetical protein
VKFAFSIFLILSAALTGCASKTKQQEQLRRAYESGLRAGQLQAQQQMQQAALPQVRFLGHVKNPIVEWSEGITLTRALMAAQYLEENTPRAITIYRNGELLHVDIQKLLAGEDYPLYPGDTVIIQN